MTLEAVIAKAMWMLGNYKIAEDNIEEIFYRKINYDVIFGREGR